MNSLENCKDTLRKLFDTNTPIIYIEETDIEFVDSLIYECVPDKDAIYEWNQETGHADFNTTFRQTNSAKRIPEKSLGEFLQYFLQKNENAKGIVSGIDFSKEGIILLKNIHPWLETENAREPDATSVKTALQHIARRRLWDETFNLTVVIVAPILKLPPEIENYTTLLDIPFPEDDEIREIIDKHAKANGGNTMPEEVLGDLRGLSRLEIHRTIDLTFCANGTLTSTESKKFLQKQKEQLIKKSNLLRLVNTDIELDDIGGLNALKNYLKGAANVFNKLQDAKKYAIPAPKGVFIVGMPGCGKSMTAKAAAKIFDCPLLQMDMGALLGKYVGESENNLRKAIKTTEAVSPCVLWIDEIEKAFAGVSGGNSGGSSDVMRRMFGYFISWMQDKEKPVFVIATANDSDALPPELKRKGRFDEIFCTLLPTADERAKIFECQIERKKKKIADENGTVKIDFKDTDYKTFGRETDGFNGADIESVVNEALKECFSKNAPSLTQTHISEAIKKTLPISKTCKAQIGKMENFFKKNPFINATSGKPTATAS